MLNITGYLSSLFTLTLPFNVFFWCFSHSQSLTEFDIFDMLCTSNWHLHLLQQQQQQQHNNNNSSKTTTLTTTTLPVATTTTTHTVSVQHISISSSRVYISCCHSANDLFHHLRCLPRPLPPSLSSFIPHTVRIPCEGAKCQSNSLRMKSKQRHYKATLGPLLYYALPHAERFVISPPPPPFSATFSVSVCLSACHWRPIDGYKLCVLIFIRFDVVNNSHEAPCCRGRNHSIARAACR